MRAPAAARKPAGSMYLKRAGPKILARALHGVGRGLFPLKRQHGDRIQLPVAREILRIDDFIVRDRRANVLARKPLAQRLDAVQPLAHRSIAVGVHVRLEAGLPRPRRAARAARQPENTPPVRGSSAGTQRGSAASALQA